MIHGRLIRRGHRAQIILIDEIVEALGDRAHAAAQPERERHGKAEAVDGGDEGHLDAVDQGRHGTRHRLVADRVKPAKAPDQADEGAQNTKARQDVRHHLQQMAVRIIVDLILADIVRDIRRAVGPAQERNVLLIFPVKIGHLKQLRARRRDLPERTLPRPDVHQRFRPLVEAFPDSPHAPETEDGREQQNQEHDAQHDQIIQQRFKACVQAEERDKTADPRRHKSDDHIGKLSHNSIPSSSRLLYLYEKSISTDKSGAIS